MKMKITAPIKITAANQVLVYGEARYQLISQRTNYRGATLKRQWWEIKLIDGARCETFDRVFARKSDAIRAIKLYELNVPVQTRLF